MKRHTDRDHRRRSVRLAGYDYAAAGAYFVTVCTHNRACLFGELLESEVRLSELGQVVAASWRDLPVRFPTVSLDEWVVMPDHFHGIVRLAAGQPDVRVQLAAWRASHSVRKSGAQHAVVPAGPAPGSIGAILGSFKSVTTKQINALRATPRMRVWQRGYYEHIVGDEAALSTVRKYIAENPLRWSLRGVNERLSPAD